jgi:hypothetical protein
MAAPPSQSQITHCTAQACAAMSAKEVSAMFVNLDQRPRDNSGWMRSRSAVGAALVAAIVALCCLGSLPALAAPGLPPAGTPDPAQMVLAPSDFAPGARVVDQGYQSNSASFPEYQRTFGAVSTTGGAHFSEVVSMVVITNDAVEGTAAFGVARAQVSSPSGRAALVRAFLQGLNKVRGRARRIRPRDVHLGHMLKLGVGDDSLLQPLSVRVHGVQVDLDMAYMRVDRAIGVLVLGAIGPSAQVAGATSLAGAMATHMRAGLSAQGGGSGSATGVVW